MSENEIRKLFEDDVKREIVYYDSMFNSYVYLYCGDEIICGKSLEEAYKVYADITNNDIADFGTEDYEARLAEMEA